MLTRSEDVSQRARSAAPPPRARRLVRRALAATATLATLTAQQPTWLRAPLVETRSGHAMAYDAARQRVVVQGGVPQGQVTGVDPDAWEWDGNTWERRAAAFDPGRRQRHAMAYDAARKRIVVFGGYTSGPWSPDTFEWDGSTWTKRAPPRSPPPRSGHAMAYDAARQRIVLFGGAYGAGLDDTWEWDGFTWVERRGGMRPRGRVAAAMAFDSGRGRVVMFGGYGSWPTNGTALNDTWEWDGSRWTEANPMTSPPARAAAAMTYDSVRGKTLLFGGAGTNFSTLNDTWQWDGANWSQASPATAPPARSGALLAFDSARNRAVMFGGQTVVSTVSAISVVADTWEWDGSTWSARNAMAEPPNAGQRPLVYEFARGRVVMFDWELPRVFEWDGTSWSWRGVQTSPKVRNFYALAHDLQRMRTVMFGGWYPGTSYADTWEWDGNAWTQRLPSTSPPPRRSHAMAYDWARGRVVLFGGQDASNALLGDTWEWDGGVWTARNPPVRPSPRRGHAMAYDVRRARVVLVGGDRTPATGTDADVWEWDGTTWTNPTPSPAPRYRIDPALAYDLTRGIMVMVAGYTPGFGLSAPETWEWNGTSWTQGPVLNAEPRYTTGVAYDVLHDRVVTFGGYGTGQGLSDTWWYGMLTPAATSTFGTGCSGRPVPPALATGLPVLDGRNVRADLVLAPAMAPAALVLAAATQTLVLGGGCTLYVQQPLVGFPLATNAAGFATQALVLPTNPALRGTTTYAQGAVVDPVGSFAGLSFTAGLRLVLGD